MKRWPPRIRCTAVALLLVLAAAVVGVPRAQAQALESVLSPGPLAQGHIRLEGECSQCHVRFDRAAQDRLCMSCHKDVAADVAAKAGLHGRLKPQACRGCHTDHKGRGARIVVFDPASFDHALTDYALRGAHRQVTCARCHLPPKKYRDASAACSACHQKDDVHKGSLGTACADCHAETRWKDTRFDHARTAFALTGRHADAACTDCHKTARHKDAPKDCIGCHRQDDRAEGHKGQFGERCESCHGTQRWKPSRFNHDTDTRQALRGKHRSVRCTDCHTGPLYKTPVPRQCDACHRKDDKHRQTLGPDCAACHTERDWKERAGFDHAKTRFPLVGKHSAATCQACHLSAVFNEAPKDCIGCHRKDDRHDATLGTDCAACHQARDWKTTAGRFDHDKTRFALRNAHAAPKLACSACHRGPRSFRPTPLDCVSCHRKDDRHDGQQGAQCEQCHVDRDWKTTRFDHARTRFALVGRHLAVACSACHATPRFKDAARECIACHRKDDRHALKLGAQCESCHSVRGWALWSHDHDRHTAFRLEGSHRQVACAACHRQPAPVGRPIAPVGSDCLACHRKDDTHDGAFGARCDQCHTPDRWKRIRARAGGVPSTSASKATP